MKSIGFLGLTFVSDNKGCMALAYSFKEMIDRNMMAGLKKIYVFSFDDYICNIIGSPIEMEVVYISIRTPSTLWNAFKKMKKCEVIFDFTEGDSFSDIYGLKRFFKVSFIKEMAIRGTSKYILCPQTYGPYSHRIAKEIAKHIIQNASYVCSRDQLSAYAVQKLTGKSIDVYTDIAFGLRKKEIKFSENSEQKKIGINVSALLWSGGYNKKNQFGLTVNYKEYIQKLIEIFIKSGQYNIHLIPHVYNDSMQGIENDYAISKRIQYQYPECIVAPRYNLPSEVKYYISQMDYFIGARMHATIGAFSTGVVTIPFSYSRKFEGLYESVNYRYIVNGRVWNTADAINETLIFINESEKLYNAQMSAMNTISEKLNKFENKISIILHGE